MVNWNKKEERRKAKILWLKPTKGNISVGRYLLAEELKKLGYDVCVIEAGGKNIFKALFYGLFSDYDLIVGVVRIGAYVGYMLSKIRGKPFIVDVTDPYHQVSYLPRILYNFFKKYEVFVLKNADQVVFITKNYMHEMMIKGVEGIKIDNGVNFEKFANPNEKTVTIASEILRKKGVDLNRPKILYLGNLIKSYNIDLILEAAKNLKNYNFIFVGDGELSRDVRVASMKLKNVYYLGFFKHEMIPGFVAHADICLCLVNADQPLKLLEYGAASKPVIAIHGELEERFTNREVYFIDLTVEALCRAVSELAESVKLRKKLGLNLKKRVSLLRWSMIARKYDKILKKYAGK